MKSEPQLVANRIRTPDGTILQSYNRHDYKTHHDKNGETYMVDGGLDYLRRSANNVSAEDLSVWSDDPHEMVREAMCWGTRGRDGKQPLTYKPLCELTTEHIEAILETQPMIWPAFRAAFERELKWRTEHDVVI
jgi:hypothetical protein